MEAESKQQSWKIHISAKAHNFNFKLRLAAATYAPTWTLSFFRLSVLLNLPNKFVFRIRSEPKQERGFIATKVMKIVHKFRPRWLKNRSNNIAAAKTQSNLSFPKDPIRVGFWVMGFVACLAKSISKNDQKGMVASSVGFFVTSLFFKKFNTTKLVNLAAFILVGAATISYFLFSYYFDYNYWYYMGRSAWNKIGNL